MAATIEELEAELTGLLKSMTAFKKSGFSSFSLDDFEAQLAGQALPAAGVCYEGAIPQGNEVDGKVNNKSTILVDMQFIIVIAIEYAYKKDAKNTKPTATALLDETRQKVLGFSKANSRGWRFIGESPEERVSGDGVVFYTQIWKTGVPVVGQHNS